MTIETLGPSTQTPSVRGTPQQLLPFYLSAAHQSDTQPHDHIIATKGRGSISLALGSTMGSTWTGTLFGLPMGSTGRVNDPGVVQMVTSTTMVNGSVLHSSSGVYPSILARVQKSSTAEADGAVSVYVNLNRSN